MTPMAEPRATGSRSFTRITAPSVARSLRPGYFRSPGPLYYPAHAAAGLAPHRVREILLIMSDHADHVVDIASTFARKVQAVCAHVTQFGNHPDVEGFLRGLATRAGAPFNTMLAEGFKRLTPS